MKAFLLFAFSFQSFGLPLACLNTSYSRTDEIEVTNDIGHLIIGAFAHHGPAFYESEVKRCLAAIETDADDFDARNDLGAAYTKLQQWDNAEAAFQENEERHPGKYETASNLGVLYKKMERFAEAEAHIRKALEIKPGGHMGLGDYYLQMIQWRKAQKGEPDPEAIVAVADDEFELPTNNFLGVPYDAGPAATAKVANKEYVVTLIKNDLAFCDAYLVLGDILFEEQDYQMALRAYARARSLSSGQAARAYQLTANDRQAAIIDIWRAQAKPGHVIEELHGHGAVQLEQEVAAAADWLTSYQEVEAALLAQGRDVSFAALNAEFEERGYEKPRLLEAIHYKGVSKRAGGMNLVIMTLFVFGGGVLVVVACVSVFIYFVFLHRPPTDGKKPLEA